MFHIEDKEQIVQVLILDNSAVENVEEFLVFITPISGLFPVSVLSSSASVSITDNDSKNIKKVCRTQNYT